MLCYLFIIGPFAGIIKHAAWVWRPIYELSVSSHLLSDISLLLFVARLWCFRNKINCVTTQIMTRIHPSNIANPITRQSQDFDTVLGECWADVVEGGPTLTRHWVNGSCSLGNIPRAKSHFRWVSFCTWNILRKLCQIVMWSQIFFQLNFRKYHYCWFHVDLTSQTVPQHRTNTIFIVIRITFHNKTSRISGLQHVKFEVLAQYLMYLITC